MMEIVIVTGLSGAGKSHAMECLEDQGYYCIDNMPPALMKNFLTLATGKGMEKVAFAMDIRGGDIVEDLKTGLEDLKELQVSYRILFLEASETVLVRRYNETRRVHPMTKKAASLKDIQEEKKALIPLRELADFIIDTSNMKVAKLKKALMVLLGNENTEETFVINIMSFGFKNGVPLTADMVFDMRFIPNPYYVASLKKYTGNSKKVQNFVMKHQETQIFVKNVDRMINQIIPCYMREGKWHLNISFGCTGGQHRSVTVANVFAQKFELQGKQVTLEHRDLKK